MTVGINAGGWSAAVRPLDKGAVGVEAEAEAAPVPSQDGTGLRVTEVRLV